MESVFAGRLLRDNKTGRIWNCDVRVEDGDTLVFFPKAGEPLPVLRSQLPAGEKAPFLEFGNLFAKASEGKKLNPELEMDELFEKELVDFARSYGPLFGNAGRTKDGREIREPLIDWASAQHVMNCALKLEAYSKGDEISPEFMDLYFKVVSFTDSDFTGWEYVFDTRVKPSALYQTAIKKSDQWGYSTEDNTVVQFTWIDGKTRLSGASPLSPRPKTLEARFLAGFPTQIYGPVPGLRPGVAPISAVPRGNIEKHVESLIKVVADKHTAGIELGFLHHYADCETKDEGGYGIVCSNFLSYMWHGLAQSYSRNAFRVCANPKCENIIAIDDEASRSKRFCGPKCRSQANNLKISEQNNRARNAFYELKGYREIYREAFGKEYSHKDPERKDLETRLDRWIEKDFMKTKKGKAAHKQGAGSKD